jgi:hypothetical protein
MPCLDIPGNGPSHHLSKREKGDSELPLCLGGSISAPVEDGPDQLPADPRSLPTQEGRPLTDDPQGKGRRGTDPARTLCETGHLSDHPEKLLEGYRWGTDHVAFSNPPPPFGLEMRFHAVINVDEAHGLTKDPGQIAVQVIDEKARCPMKPTWPLDRGWVDEDDGKPLTSHGQDHLLRLVLRPFIVGEKVAAMGTLLIGDLTSRFTDGHRRTGIDNPSHPDLSCQGEEALRRLHVHPVQGGRIPKTKGIDPCHMVEEVAASERVLVGRGVEEVSKNRDSPFGRDPAGGLLLANQGQHPPSFPEQTIQDRPSDKARGTREEGGHLHS